MSPPIAPLVELENVGFAYDPARPVLSGIRLSMRCGEVVAIMGQSGCGKTTLLRLIGGQLRATQGQVRLAGQNLATQDEAGLYALRRRMGMLFQFGALFTDLTVFDNVAFPLREHTDLPETMIRDLVLMKLHAVGLRGVRDRLPSELSGGMARRVALARAVALDPQLILYDEPFTGLDPISLSVIGALVRRLNEALGACSVIVTHDVQETLKIADRIVFVADGRIIAQGTSDEIRHSAAPFVHQFIWGEMDGPVPFHYPALPKVRAFLGAKPAASHV